MPIEQEQMVQLSISMKALTTRLQALTLTLTRTQRLLAMLSGLLTQQLSLIERLKVLMIQHQQLSKGSTYHSQFRYRISREYRVQLLELLSQQNKSSKWVASESQSVTK